MMIYDGINNRKSKWKYTKKKMKKMWLLYVMLIVPVALTILFKIWLNVWHFAGIQKI